VRKLGVRFTALVRLGDVVTCKGRVVATSEKNGARLVELEVWAENQRGEKVVTGRATAAIPSRLD
jgi:acyl dehydratase